MWYLYLIFTFMSWGFVPFMCVLCVCMCVCVCVCVCQVDTFTTFCAPPPSNLHAAQFVSICNLQGAAAS
jgi:hypothetical protein